METIRSIRDFWFGDSHDDAVVAEQQSALWWSKDAELDAAIRLRFSDSVAAADAGRLDHWSETALGRLVLILLTDQFPRNIFRDTAAAFASDTRALAWCKQGLADKADRSLRPIERVFFYLPLEHSESLADQQLSLSLFSALRAEADSRHHGLFDGFLQFAKRHHEIIVRFGRFPHRNQVLGRVSTPEEATFLTQAGSSF